MPDTAGLILPDLKDDGSADGLPVAGCGLSDDPPPEPDDEAIARLAKLPVLDYERCRETEAEKLGCRVSMLDKLVQQARGEQGEAHGRFLKLHDPDPWPEAIATSDVLDLLAAAVRRHVVLSAQAADVVALWIAHTWVFTRFDHSPRLGITSPTRRCGKSTLMEVLRATCRRTLKADSISASGVFRTVESLKPLSLLIDEADTFMKDNEELRGVLNSGYERSGQVIRVIEVQGEHRPTAFATYAPVALAAIGELPSTLADRAVPIRMQRKATSDAVQRMRSGDNRARLAEIARKLTRWSRDAAADLPTDPRLPDALNDREGDISVPLIAIADHAGPAWAARARAGLLAVFGLRAENDANLEVGATLLADLRLIFLGTSSERMTSAKLCADLATMDDRPWPEWRNGKPMTAVQLAAALRPFDIRPTTLRIGAEPSKGYYREAFEEAWSRYVPTPETPAFASEGGSDPLHRNMSNKSTSYGKNGAVTPKSGLRPKNPEICSQEQQCYGVTGSTPLHGANGHVTGDEVVL